MEPTPSIIEPPEIDSPWSKQVPNLRVAWDSTSMKSLQTCPRKFYLEMVQHWHSKKFQAPLVYGILFHSAMETYHKSFAETADYESACQAALDFCLDKGRELEQSDDNTRTKFTLLRCVIWYLDQFKTDPVRTVMLRNGKPAVELSFRAELPLTSPDGEPYIWCGHIDRLGYEGEEDDYLVTDYKTTKGSLGSSFSRRFSPDVQVSGYLYGATMILPELPLRKVMIDGAELKVNFNRYLRVFAPRTPGQMEEWVNNICIWIQLAENFAKNDAWPMNEESCDKYGGCVFQDVCSKDPSTRKVWLKGDFKKTEWNPLENREP